MRDFKQALGDVLWLVSRVAAGVVGATVTGMVIAAASCAPDAGRCLASCPNLSAGAIEAQCIAIAPTCSSLRYEAIFTFSIVPMFSLAIGTVPGIAALSLPATRNRNWRTLPLLVIGTAAGFLACNMFLSLVNVSPGASWVAPFLFLVAPTLALFGTAFLVGRVWPNKST